MAPLWADGSAIGVSLEASRRLPEVCGLVWSFGESWRAAMAGRAAIRKQMRRRFALIEILGMGRRAGQRIDGAENEQTPSQRWLRHELC